MGGTTGTVAGLDAIAIDQIVIGLVNDLEKLSRGEITIPMARARTQMAHEILRGINIVITGHRLIQNKAKALNGPGPIVGRSKRKTGGR